MHRTLQAVLDHRARAAPRAPLLRFGARAWDAQDWAAHCEAVAALLWHGWGVRPGDRLAWLGHNHAQQVALLFALARLGASLLPLNFRLAPAEWQAQLADCTPRWLVHDDALAGPAQQLAAAAGLPARGVAQLDAPAAHPAAPDAGGPDRPALLVYTSGTTRQPRAAVHTQANLLANMAAAQAVQALVPGDRVLTVLPLFHVGGLCIQTLPAIGAGGEVLLHDRFTPEATLQALEAGRPTLTLQVPATMRALVEHPRWGATDLRSLRAVWAGSSLLPAALVAAFHARGVPLCNVYGATETGPFSIALGPDHAQTHAGACGWPAPDVEARIAPIGAPAADGSVEGELWLRGPAIVRHYWPDVPACDAQGWFHTGDLARRAADGCHTIVGRAKELIISGGENIHPAEIEDLLAEHPAVAECAAFGRPDARWGEAVAVALVLKPGMQATPGQLRAHLAGRLAPFKLPRHWQVLPALPRTALGKLQRHRLPGLPAQPLPDD